MRKMFPFDDAIMNDFVSFWGPLTSVYNWTPLHMEGSTPSVYVADSWNYFTDNKVFRPNWIDEYIPNIIT